jgi:hypothetical protein
MRSTTSCGASEIDSLVLGTVFLVLAWLALAAGIAFFWQSVRAALRAAPGPDDADLVSVDRAWLLDEKEAALRALKDLEFERGMGKVSEADFVRLQAQYRARARAVLAALDTDLGPWRARAEELVGPPPEPPASLAEARHSAVSAAERPE